MDIDKEPTVVVLRRFRDDKSVIAIFAELPGTRDWTTCCSYQHVGQHGSCDAFITPETDPVKVTEPDAAALLQELRGLGYKPVVRQRISWAMHERRRKALNMSCTGI